MKGHFIQSIINSGLGELLGDGLSARYDHHDKLIYFTYGGGYYPTRDELEEFVRLVRRLYDTTPDGWVDSMNEAMAARWEVFNRQPEPRGRAGYIYLARIETGHHKIGLSIGPIERIRVFNTQMPVKVELVHTIETDDMFTAERLLHERFADKRYEGEWFNLSENDTAYICSISGYFDGRWVQE